MNQTIDARYPPLFNELHAWKWKLRNEGPQVLHSDYPLSDWVSKVINDDTRQSYYEWVVHAICHKHEELDV